MNTREQSNMIDYKNWVIQRAKELRMNPTESEVKFLKWVKKIIVQYHHHNIQ